MIQIRDNQWLTLRLSKIWQRYFHDVKKMNTVIVSFGKKARTRLGSINYLHHKTRSDSHILITGFFRNSKVPQFVVDGVLAHELVHYAHGFQSPHKRLYRHPHRNGVVEKELTSRGFGGILKRQQDWLQKNWRNHLKHESARLRVLRHSRA